MSTHHIHKESVNYRNHQTELWENIKCPNVGQHWDNEAATWARRKINLRIYKNYNLDHSFLKLEPLEDMKVNMKRLSDKLGQIVPAELDHDCVTPAPLELSYLNNAYEPGKDGLLHFKTYFNISDFASEDVNVTTNGNNLTVEASKTRTQEDEIITESFGRTIIMPDSVDVNKLKVSMTSDGILITEAPVIDPNYSTIMFEPRVNLVITPLTGAEHKQLVQTNEEGIAILDTNAGKKKIHLELSVDMVYGPNDIYLWAVANTVLVRADRQITSEITDASGQCDQQVGKYQLKKIYILPGLVDVSTMRAELNDGILLVEAPLTQI